MARFCLTDSLFRPTTMVVCLWIVESCLLVTVTVAQEPNAKDSVAQETREQYALILVGLPGDQEHELLFRSILDDWETWLTESLQFSKENITVLSDHDAADVGRMPATRDNVRTAVGRLNDAVGPRDTLWFFYLGHANYDGRRAWLHLPGPDMNDMELAELFSGVKCRDQVFWLTNTCSGWFLKPLSREGRIVITATEADNEFNETEFPAALASVTRQAVTEMDINGDSRISLAELFVAISHQVEARFASDKRAPTEHAQLDDNGDGRGTEAGELAEPDTAIPTAKGVPASLRRDGARASAVLLPWSIETDESGSSESGSSDE